MADDVTEIFTMWILISPIFHIFYAYWYTVFVKRFFREKIKIDASSG